MKTLKYLLSYLLVSLTLSCSLEEDPRSFVDNESFYQNKEQCVSAVNSCYPALKNIYRMRMFLLTDVHTDLLNGHMASIVQSYLDISPAQPGWASTVWTQCYQAIMYANSALAGIEGSPLDEETKTQLMGEAAILRAYYYYVLTSSFGNVPFYTEDVGDTETMNRVAKLPRMSAVDTRTYLINELQDYIPSLPQIRTSEVSENRAGAAVGLMLIAKMAMWNAAQDTQAPSETYWYDVALDALSSLQDIYGALSQYPLSDIRFRHKNTAESIFEVQHTYTTGGVVYCGDLACCTMPTRTAGDDKTIYNGVKIEELGENANIWTPIRPNVYLCAGLQFEGSGDLRAKLNMAWEYNGERFTSVVTRPWMGPKFWCPYMYDSNDNNNYKLFRYADALLMMAECYWAKEDQANMLACLNEVRSRAGLGDYQFVNWRKAFAEIQDERARELVGEFQRKYDLVRWGIWYERVTELNDDAVMRENARPCHQYLPIPDKEVVYSGYALDNEEYNKYGL